MAELVQNTIDLYDEIMSRHHFLTLNDTGEVLYFDGSKYDFGGDNVIWREIARLAGRCTMYTYYKILSKVKENTCVNRDIFDVNPMLVNTVDGIFGMSTRRIMPHGPKIPLRTKLNVRYDPKALPTKFMRFLVEVIEDPQDRQTILEMFAASLLRKAFNPKKAVILFGNGANGKSVLLRTMFNIFGDNDASVVSTWELLRNKFSKASLDSKMFNVCGDISLLDFKRLHELSGIIIGEEVAVKRKYKTSFMMRPHAKMFFTANRLPDNMDDPIYKHFIIIKFGKQFEGKDCNPSLLEELTTGEEKSGIFNLLVDNARNLMKQGCLTRDLRNA